MTADMTFECLLVSSDLKILSMMNRLLERFSIDTKVCMTISRALELLPRSTADLIVVDWDESEIHAGFLHRIWNSGNQPKPTIVAISNTGRSIPGAHVVVKKPLTYESGAKSMSTAYSRMLVDHRQYARHTVLIPLQIVDEHNRVMKATLTDIGQGGLGLRLKDVLHVDEVVTFDVVLPEAKRSIHVEARVVWWRRYVEGHDAFVGCDFLRMPPVDHDILHDWLKNKCKIKIKEKQFEMC